MDGCPSKYTLSFAILFAPSSSSSSSSCSSPETNGCPSKYTTSFSRLASPPPQPNVGKHRKLHNLSKIQTFKCSNISKFKHLDIETFKHDIVFSADFYSSSSSPQHLQTSRCKQITQSFKQPKNQTFKNSNIKKNFSSAASSSSLKIDKNIANT